MAANSLDLTNLAADLYGASDNIEEATQNLLVSAGQQILAEAQSLVHVKTGTLKNSIRLVAIRNQVTVGPDAGRAPYGAYVEYGTGSRGEFPGSVYEIKPKNGEFLVFKVHGRTVYARSVKHPGSRPFPYMRPAATEWVQSLPGNVADVGVSLIVGHKGVS